MTTHPALPHAHPADVGLCPERTQRLMDVLRREVTSGRLPGAVAMVARRGQIALLEAVGQQNPATGQPMQTDSIFRIYSMTTPVVSVDRIEPGTMLAVLDVLLSAALSRPNQSLLAA
jgi:CubicO group peptidase (beta-lactamase class C family)